MASFRRKRFATAIGGGFIVGGMLGLMLLILTPFFASVGDTAPHTAMRGAGMLPPSGCAQLWVHDGDTFRCDAVKVRLVAGRGPVDAPEMPGSPRCEAGRDGWCDSALADRARARLDAILRSGPIVLECAGEDRYHRALCRASVGGRDAGDTLVDEGLARIVEAWR